MKDLVNKLGLSLESHLGEGFDYVKTRYSLVKKLNDGAQVITIALLPSSRSNSFKLAMNAHIRINVLEDQYAHFHPFLNAKNRKTNPTVVVNCDTLLSDKELTKSIPVDENNLEEIAAKYAKAIRDDVFPFFEEYYSIGRLVSSFEQSDPKLWITSDRNTRGLILLSAYALESNWDAFDKASLEYLEYCNKPFAQTYKPLAQAVIDGLSLRRAKSQSVSSGC